VGHLSFDHRVDSLKMRGIGQERKVDLKKLELAD
jgi:hypothetical protein